MSPFAALLWPCLLIARVGIQGQGGPCKGKLRTPSQEHYNSLWVQASWYLPAQTTFGYFTWGLPGNKRRKFSQSKQRTKSGREVEGHRKPWWAWASLLWNTHTWASVGQWTAICALNSPGLFGRVLSIVTPSSGTPSSSPKLCGLCSIFSLQCSPGNSWRAKATSLTLVSADPAQKVCSSLAPVACHALLCLGLKDMQFYWVGQPLRSFVRSFTHCWPNLTVVCTCVCMCVLVCDLNSKWFPFY